MTHETVNRTGSVLLLLAVFCLAACIPTRYFVKPEPVEGVITDYETGDPIPDAFVVARWTGTSGGLGHGGGAICFHVEVTKTDAEGRYFIPPPEIESDYPKYREPRILITAYKPGYRRPYWVNNVPSPTDQLHETDEKSAERMDYLSDVIRDTSCPQAGKSGNNLLPLYEALYADSVQATRTTDDKKSSLYILRELEIFTVDYDEAAKLYRERVDCIEKELACINRNKEIEEYKLDPNVCHSPHVSVCGYRRNMKKAACVACEPFK